MCVCVRLSDVVNVMLDGIVCEGGWEDRREEGRRKERIQR